MSQIRRPKKAWKTVDDADGFDAQAVRENNSGSQTAAETPRESLAEFLLILLLRDPISIGCQDYGRSFEL